MKRPILIGLLAAAVVLVLAGIGAVLFFATSDELVFNRQLFSATEEESKSLKVDGAVTLTIDNDAGDVTVIGGDVEKVEVKAVKTGYATTQTQAEKDLKNIKYEIKQSGDKITITYKLPKINSTNIDTVDFIVTVPTETTVSVEGNFGEISVANTTGMVEIKNGFGDVTVENTEGALSVTNNSGDINATAIKANSKNIDLRSDFGNIILEKANATTITFKSSSGTISMKDVNATGDLTVESDFGDLNYENGSAKSVTVEMSSGTIEISKVKISGLVKADNDFGNIELMQTNAASYDLHTSSGTITIDGAKGKLKAYTDFGNIEINNAQAVTLDLDTNSGNINVSGTLGDGPHSVSSDFGDITLTLPSDAKLSVELKTDFGNIKSDLPITVTLTEGTSSDGDEIVGEINGGGGVLTVQTNSGGITIKASK